MGWDSKLNQRTKVDVFLTLRITFVCLVIEQVEPSNGVKSKAVSPLSFEELLLYSWVQFSLEFNTTSERSLKFGNIPDRLLPWSVFSCRLCR